MVGDIPVQRRRSRHAHDDAHDRRRERRARGLRQRPGAAGAGTEARAAGAHRRRSRARSSPPTRSRFVSPSVDDHDAVGAGEGALVEGRGQFRSDQFVRAQIVWSTRAGPDRAGDRGDAHQRRSSSRSWRNQGDNGSTGAAEARRAARRRSSATTTSCESGLKAGEQLIVSGLQKIRRRRAGDGRPPAAPRAGSRRAPVRATEGPTPCSPTFSSGGPSSRRSARC